MASTLVEVSVCRGAVHIVGFLGEQPCLLVFLFECLLRLLLLVALPEGADAPVVDPERYRVAYTLVVCIFIGLEVDTVLQVPL